MRKILSVAIAALIAGASGWPALAEDKRPRNSAGGLMDVSAWHAIETHEFMLNIGDLPGVEPMRAQARLRLKTVPHHRMWFDYRGFILVEHVKLGVYGQRVTHRFRSREAADKYAESYWKSVDEPFDVEDTRKIYVFQRRAGWVLATRGRRSGRLCFIARLGILSDPRKGPFRSREHYDTSIFFRDCSGSRWFGDVATWLEGARIVGSRHHRAGQR